MINHLSEIEPQIQCRLKLGAWQVECRKVLSLLSRTNNASGGGSTLLFYRELVEVKCDEDLEVPLRFDDSQLTGIFRRTFGPGP